MKRWVNALLGIQCCAALAAGAADRAHTLNVYAWPDYFPPPLIAKFQAETGIHINYAVFDDPAMAETTLSVGSSGYDIVTMSASPELGREIPKGFWLKRDQARIPNARNADPKVMQLLQAVDPGNRYAVPWMWGTTGLIYNTDKITAIMPNAPVGSLDMVLKKEIAARLHQFRDAAGDFGRSDALHRLRHRQRSRDAAAGAGGPRQCHYLSAGIRSRTIRTGEDLHPGRDADLCPRVATIQGSGVKKARRISCAHNDDA